MKIKTADLIGPALDWAVATIEEGTEHVQFSPLASSKHYFAPSKKWSQGGPIIEREKLSVGTRHTNEHIHHDADVLCWARNTIGGFLSYGPTPLIAAMRCFVASRLGDEVEIPEELK